jgi:hypothetical protein
LACAYFGSDNSSKFSVLEVLAVRQGLAADNKQNIEIRIPFKTNRMLRRRSHFADGVSDLRPECVHGVVQLLQGVNLQGLLFLIQKSDNTGRRGEHWPCDQFSDR